MKGAALNADAVDRALPAVCFLTGTVHGDAARSSGQQGQVTVPKHDIIDVQTFQAVAAALRDEDVHAGCQHGGRHRCRGWFRARFPGYDDAGQCKQLTCHFFRADVERVLVGRGGHLSFPVYRKALSSLRCFLRRVQLRADGTPVMAVRPARARAATACTPLPRAPMASAQPLAHQQSLVYDAHLFDSPPADAPWSASASLAAADSDVMAGLDCPLADASWAASLAAVVADSDVMAVLDCPLSELDMSSFPSLGVM